MKDDKYFVYCLMRKIKMGDKMFFRKTKIRYFEEDRKQVQGIDDIDLTSTLMTVSSGLGKLKKEYIVAANNGDEYDSNLAFVYKEAVLYTASHEFYGCPTCEKIIRRYHPEFNHLEVVEKMEEYRMVMGQEKSEFKEILRVNEMIFQLLESGTYRISLKKIFPTYGQNGIFSDFTNGQEVKASVDTYYQYMDNAPVCVDSHTAYMLPTQSTDNLTEETIQQYRQKSYLGRGLLIAYTGFLGVLLDGHHKATVAFERGEALECLVIEPLEKGIPKSKWRPLEVSASELLQSRTKNIPNIDDYCLIIHLIEAKELQSHAQLRDFIAKVLNEKILLQEGEMDCLLSYCHVFEESRLIDFYPLMKRYDYKDIRVSYFEKLASFENSTAVDELMLNYLINDEYDNATVTKICDKYFEDKLNE